MPRGEAQGSDGSGGGEETVGYIEPIEIQEEMERSFLEYSMSVIVSRALPDVRDGLKPVHRRILYSMYDQRLLPDRPHTKCAKVVGDVMGSYHPHGDSAIYEALARMVQDFSMRHPLIDGHGNFGGTGPDEGPAAMRYTECRLDSLALQLMEGIDQETVDFTANYDATSEEPTVLPSRFPNLLVNGSQGIAVGMATNIPPHNLGEVIDAAIHLLEHPDATPDDLMAFIQGPDFPTGALILGRQGLQDALRTGRGSIKMRAVAEIEEGRAGDTRIVVTEMPYQTSVATVAKKIEDLVRSGDLDGIAEAQDDSAGGKTRLVIRVKRDANANVVTIAMIETQQALGKLACLVHRLFLFQRIDQIDGGEEADLLAVMLDGLHTKRGGNVRLAGAGPTDEHHVIGAIDELAAVQLADHGFIDLAGCEVKACHILVGWEARCLDLIINGPDLALRRLGF